MQILGKRSRVLLTVLCAVMLIAIGISFAAWDITVVKADGGNMSDYANAKVGDIVTFGQYYQNNEKVEIDGVMQYEKTPLEWLVVDKNERTGQLTLMTKYIVACGGYFGNYYDAGDGKGYRWGYNPSKSEVNGVPYNQAYCDSTLRAYLNNLERMDMGGDRFVASNAENNLIGGYIPSGNSSTLESGLLSSVGFSNKRQHTDLTVSTFPEYINTPGFHKRIEFDSLYYQRPLDDGAYLNRPAAKGFFDEAFNDNEKAKIIPKTIAGYIGHRWPDNKQDSSTVKYINGTEDKVWAPSATELNIMNAKDWMNTPDDAWSNSNDEAASTVFEYFKNYANYNNSYADRKNTSLEDALKAQRTGVATNGMAGNYSIPVYDYQTTTPKTAISEDANTSNRYWTRTPSSLWYYGIRFLYDTGLFAGGWDSAHASEVGARPCITLQY